MSPSLRYCRPAAGHLPLQKPAAKLSMTAGLVPPERLMKDYSQISVAVAATVVATFSAGLAFAQTAPAAGTDAATPPAATTPATPAPAATAPTPAPATSASPTPAPAASSTPAASPAPAAATPAPAASSTPDKTTPAAATETKEAKPTKKRKRMTRQQEIDHSIATGTVPSRFRSSVPGEYQKYIPFEKR